MKRMFSHPIPKPSNIKIIFLPARSWKANRNISNQDSYFTIDMQKKNQV